MAITQISQVQVRRGLNQDLPQLAAGELGWSTDTQQLYIGNGTLGAPDYAPSLGHTEILTQYSILNFTTGFAANVLILQGNVITLQNEITSLQNSIGVDTSTTLNSLTNYVTSFSSNNAVVNYTINQGSNQRTGIIKIDRATGSSTVGYDEEYSQSGAVDVIMNITANTGYTTVWANTLTATGSLSYRITSL